MSEQDGRIETAGFRALRAEVLGSDVAAAVDRQDAEGHTHSIQDHFPTLHYMYPGPDFGGMACGVQQLPGNEGTTTLESEVNCPRCREQLANERSQVQPRTQGARSGRGGQVSVGEERVADITNWIGVRVHPSQREAIIRYSRPEGLMGQRGTHLAARPVRIRASELSQEQREELARHIRESYRGVGRPEPVFLDPLDIARALGGGDQPHEPPKIEGPPKRRIFLQEED